MHIQVNKILHNKSYSSQHYPNDTADWSDPVNLSPENVRDIIFTGKAIKFGIQTDRSKKNRNESVEYADGVYIDIDDINSEVLKEIIADPLSSYAFLIHHTHSSPTEDGFISIHICFEYDSRVESWQTQRTIARKLYSYYQDKYSDKINITDDNGKVDKGCFNPNRIKYGTDKPDRVICFPSVSPKLPLNDILLLPDTLNGSVDRSTIDENIYFQEISPRTKEIFDHLQFDLRELIQWDDPSEVFCFYKDGHEFSKRQSNISGAIQYDGYDPREDDKAGRSKSFVATRLSSGVWIWRSRARNIGGSLPEYYYRVANDYWLPEPVSKEMWWEGIKEIYTRKGKKDLFFDRYSKLPKPHDLLTKYINELFGQIYFSADERIWLYKDNWWQELPERQFTTNMKDWIIRNYTLGARKILPKEYYDLMKIYYNFLPSEYQVDSFLHDWNYYPFKNCLFNLKTKQAVSYDKNIRNTFISSYIYLKKDEYEYPQKLIDFFRLVLKYPEHSELLLDIIVLIVHGKLFKTGCLLQLMGESGTGKTTVSNFIYKCLHRYNEEPDNADLDKFCSGENRFHVGMILLSKLRLVIFQDQSSVIYNTTNLKNVVNGVFNPNKEFNSYMVEQKNARRMVNVNFNSQFIITSERDIFRANAHSGGELRRTWSFEFAHQNLDAARLADEFSSYEYINKFIQWAVNQDGDALLAKYKNPDESIKNWLKLSKDRMMQTSDPVYAFVKECIIITDNDEDFVLCEDLYNRWNNWKGDEMDVKAGKISKAVLGKTMKKHLLDLYNYDSSAHKITKRIRMPGDDPKKHEYGKARDGYQRMKLNPNGTNKIIM